MRHRHLLIYLFFVSGIFFSSLTQCSTSKPSFEKLVKYSSFVGLIELDSIQPLSADCGFLVSGKVLENYKGTETKIKFIVKFRSDISRVGSKHFLMAFEKKVSDECADTRFRASAGTQSIFPFYEIDGNYILVSRQSFLSTYGGSYYVRDENISNIVVLSNRMYALARWNVIKKKLKKILSTRLG